MQRGLATRLLHSVAKKRVETSAAFAMSKTKLTDGETQCQTAALYETH